MRQYDELPMMKPFLSFLIGILMAYYFDFPFHVYLVLTFVFLFIGLILMTSYFKKTKWMALSGFSILLSLLFVGSMNYSYKKNYQPLKDGYYSYQGVISKVISRNSDYTRCYLDIIDVNREPIAHPYTVISNISDTLIYAGDTIWASSTLRPLMPSLNPGQFDVRKYYGYKYIYQTSTIKKGNFFVKPFKGFFHFQRWCQQSAVWCGEIFRKFVPERSSLTLQALLLGIKNEISQDMMEVYMQSGVMHVLAVSGMHVGILYVGLLTLLRPLYRRWKYITFISILLVWIFSFITGGGPAILRAAIMLTFVDIGKKINNQSNPVNLLLVSGFILLLFQPYLVWDIGFQLSFVAMLGIFYLMRPIQNLFYFNKNWVKNFLWAPTAMSISAQLATTPLTFYYFGNFPVYFILTNIFILLPITLALYGGILLLLTSFIFPDNINLAIGKILDNIIFYGFDGFLQWMTSLPGAYVNHIYLSFWQVVILSMSIYFFGYWLYHLKNGKWLIGSIMFLFISFLGSWIREYRLSIHPQAHILHVSGQHAIAAENFIWSNTMINDSIIQKNGFFLNGYLRNNGFNSWRIGLPSYAKGDSCLVTIGKSSIFVLNQNLNNFSSENPLVVDYLILGNQLYLNTDELLKKINFSCLVLDAALDYKKYQLFKRLLTEAQIPFYDIRVSGALKISL
ncbi:MAG: ComEC family competence protein [Chitinophagales bacterium]|nr:ComEC family competence protein [Chitinophagales bacterium]MCZ2392813.1 ComEC family competence protein [Chitinophagales bacterium]